MLPLLKWQSSSHIGFFWSWYRLYFFEINRQRTTGNSVMFMLLHWYCHKDFGCGKMITFTLKIFNILGEFYTRDGTISLCQRDASAQVVISHNPSLVTKWHDRHRYLSIHHVPYRMSLSSPRHCSKTLTFTFRYEYLSNTLNRSSFSRDLQIRWDFVAKWSDQKWKSRFFAMTIY